MGVVLKICKDCGVRKPIGRSKSRCKSCRVADPDKFRNRPAGTSPRRKKTRRITVGPFIDWPVNKIPKCAYPHNQHYSPVPLGAIQVKYVLVAYGYADYAAYLRSEMWQGIREKILRSAKCHCGCGRIANQVHHKFYSEANLLGYTTKGLVAITHGCHYAIEFTDKKKNNLSEANRKLKLRRKSRLV